MSGIEREEREIIVRDKAAREGMEVPDEVFDWLVERFDTPQALKSGLVNIAMYAAHYRKPIDVALSKFVIDGERPALVAVAEDSKNSEDISALETPESADILPQEECRPTQNEQRPDPVDAEAAADSVPEQPSLDFGFGPTDFSTASTQQASPATSPAPVTTPLSAPAPAPEPAAPAASGPQASARPADVYFMSMRTERKRSLLERIVISLDRCGLEQIVSPGDKVAVKVHFGEEGNTAFVSPLYARAVVQRIKELGGKPFLTDANTLYSGMRTNAIDHLNCALANGFGYTMTGAPIIIADGLVSRDSIEVPIEGGKHFDSVRVSSAVDGADAMVVITHVKGHAEAGFGAALKNVGMGLGSRSAKQRMHSGIKPKVEFDRCTACGRCIEWCPEACIDLRVGKTGKRHAFIRRADCIGCGECMAACAYGAIEVNWESPAADFLEKIVEHAAGVLRGKDNKVAYLNFMTNISPDCDCWSFSDAAVVPDIGVLASTDIVAIDQASIDFVTRALGNAGSRGEGIESGVEKFHAIHGVDPGIAMAAAEGMGLGTRGYTIKEIG